MEERVLYGYMDGDYLQCIEIAPIPQKIRNEKTGEITTRMVSVIEQVAELPTIYKPVDAIDESNKTQIRRAMLCALCHTMPGTGFHSDT